MVIVGWPRPDVTRLLPSQMNEIRDVVAAMILVDHRCRRVVAHAARAEEVHRKVLLGHRRLRDPQRARRFEDLGAAILQEPRVREIVRMILVGHANRRETPRILQRPDRA